MDTGTGTGLSFLECNCMFQCLAGKAFVLLSASSFLRLAKARYQSKCNAQTLCSRTTERRSTEEFRSDSFDTVYRNMAYLRACWEHLSTFCVGDHLGCSLVYPLPTKSQEYPSSCPQHKAMQPTPKRLNMHQRPGITHYIAHR